MYQLATAPQSIGGVLDSGFRLFRACLKQTFLLAAVAALFGAPIGLVAQTYAVQAPSAATVVLLAIGVLVCIAVLLALTAAIIARIDAIAHGRELSVSEALAVGVRRGPALFGAGICYGLAVALGMVLLIIPGLIVMVSMIFGPYAAVIDRLGPISSLGYSRRLVRGHWWRTAALVTIVGIILIVFYLILGVIIGVSVVMNAEQLAEGAMPWYIDFVLSPLMSGLATPFGYALFLAMYNDLKLRHEGSDIAERIAASAA